jgi:hypothetical protein
MRNIWILTMLALIAGLALANSLYTTVKYIVPQDLAFTISYPAGTTEMWFQPSLQTAEVNATNQTSGQPIILYTNTGNVVEYYDLAINETNPATITLKCGPANGAYQAACGCEGSTGSPMLATKCCNVTTATSRVNASSIAIGATQPLWCWAQFVSTPYGTYLRNMTSNSSAS